MIESELLEKAEKGEFDAIYQVGNSYYFGNGVQQDYKRAYAYYVKAFSINPRDPDLNNSLGLCFINGEGIEQMPERGVAFFKAAVAFGSVVAHANLGLAYQKGQGVEQDFCKAAEHFTIAADAGNTRAMIKLAEIYDRGEGVDKDPEKAYNYYKKAADGGDPDGYFNLGRCYMGGDGVEQNPEKSVECMMKAAESGNMLSEHCLGEFYRLGWGVEQNLGQAAFWYKKSADHGYEPAISQFAICTFENENANRGEIVEAVNYLTRAANLGLPEPTFNLAFLYRDGKFVPQNQELAYKLWVKGGNAGSGPCSRMAGVCCRDGVGTQKNYEKSMQWFMQAAQQGESDCAMLAGMEFLQGTAIQKNYNKALSFFLKAAELGNMAGFYYAGYVYESPDFADRDLNLAYQYYSAAADGGYPDALAAKGSFHLDGAGGAEKNEELGMELLEKAFDGGSAIAGAIIANTISLYDAERLNSERCFNLCLRLAKSGNTDAQYTMWRYYNEGIFVNVDIDKANDWLKKAADGGNNTAAGIFGFVMKSEGNIGECVKYWEKSQENNLKSKTELGLLYINGEGGFSDVSRGLELIEEAADTGYPEAITILGQCYAEGRVVPRDSFKAVTLLEKAANGGFVRAQLVLGGLYFNGNIFPKDINKAEMWLSKAAAAGDADANLMLGELYYIGKTVPENPEKAIFHLKAAMADEEFEFRCDALYYCGMAYVKQKNYNDAFVCFLDGARAGDAQCQYQAGISYTFGEGVNQDISQAKFWLEKARENGVDEAAELLKKIAADDYS